MARKFKYMIVTAMKNEGPYILDWVAHYLSLGVEHFFVVTNDCDDYTDRLLDRLGELGHVTHVINPKVLNRDQGAWQVKALRYARLFNVVRDAQWIMHCDADEFLQFNAPISNFDEFFEHIGKTDVVSFTSVPYNSSGKQHLEDLPPPSRFTQRNKYYSKALEADEIVLNAVKTIYRNDVPFDLRRNHRPLMENFSKSGYVWRDGSGRIFPPEYTDTKFKAVDAVRSVEFAQLNHYAIRCMEGYLVKVDRGDVMDTARLGNSVKYWTDYNMPGDDDDRYEALSPKAQEIRESFGKDEELADWHAKSVACHKAKVERILKSEQGRALAEQLGYKG